MSTSPRTRCSAALRRENPSTTSASKSSRVPILLVAWRDKASANSSRGMPQPSSVTRIRLAPPPSTSTAIVRAPASSEFSTSSLTTDAGALHDLAGRDLIDELRGQDANRHGTPTARACAPHVFGEREFTPARRAGSTAWDRQDLADAQNVGAQAVRATDARGAHAISLRDTRQRLATSNDVTNHLRRRRREGSRRSNCLPAGWRRSSRRCPAAVRRRAPTDTCRCAAKLPRADSRYTPSRRATDGMSGDFSTRNGACCTSRRRIAVTADMRRIKRWPAAMLAFNAALCDKSSSTRASI